MTRKLFLIILESIGCGLITACTTQTTATPTAIALTTPLLPTPRATLTPRPTTTINGGGSIVVNTQRDPGPTPTPTLYTIQDGETLIPIANRFGVSVADLIVANPGLEPGRIQVGQRLIIPSAGISRSTGGVSAGQLLPSPTPSAYTTRGVNVYRTAAGSLECLGVVFNPGPSALNNVQLQITLFDDANKVLTSAIFFVALDIIGPGQTSPFRVLFTEPPPTFSRFTIRPMRGEAIDTTARFAKMEIIRKEGAILDNTQFKITGDVVNRDTVNVRNARVIVTTYDDQKQVIGFRNVPLADGNVPANSQIAFEVTLVSASKVAEYAISVEGLK